MARLTIALGVALVVLGIVAYAASDSASMTALIPSVVGALVGACGTLGLRPGWHRPAVIATVLVAALGLVGAVMGLARGEEFTLDRAKISQLVMAGVCGLLAVLGVVHLVRGGVARPPRDTGPTG